LLRLEELVRQFLISREALSVRVLDAEQDPTPLLKDDFGLLRLEELVRQFLISREALSVRVLDAEQDPTPLLKEIRDDKVPTIIIDGSAATAGLVLAKASELGMTSTFYKYILTTMVSDR
ncbi:glutamate receptor ionotropic, kainate 5-like, partial [Geospiza fortis]|uniref:Glutamate receptor ionotropic, kainate 5-like n=1 Tax=Geospiza fortis TaxID=48883 RepID=A0A8N5I5J8_GEOFO